MAKVIKRTWYGAPPLVEITAQRIAQYARARVTESSRRR